MGAGNQFIADYLVRRRESQARDYESTRYNKEKEMEAANQFYTILQSLRDNPESGVTAKEKRSAYLSLPETQKKMVPLWVELGVPMLHNPETGNMEPVFKQQAIPTEQEQRGVSLQKLRKKDTPESKQRMGSILFGDPGVERKQKEAALASTKASTAYTETLTKQAVSAKKLSELKYQALGEELERTHAQLGQPFTADQEEAFAKVFEPFNDKIFKLEFQRVKDITLPEDIPRRIEGISALTSQTLSFMRNMGMGAQWMDKDGNVQYHRYVHLTAEQLKDQLLDEFQFYTQRESDVPPRIVSAFNRFWSSPFFPKRRDFAGILLNSPGFEPIWGVSPDSEELLEELEKVTQQGSPEEAAHAASSYCMKLYEINSADVSGFQHEPKVRRFWPDKPASERPSFRENKPRVYGALIGALPQECMSVYKEAGLIGGGD